MQLLWIQGITVGGFLSINHHAAKICCGEGAILLLLENSLLEVEAAKDVYDDLGHLHKEHLGKVLLLKTFCLADGVVVQHGLGEDGRGLGQCHRVGPGECVVFPQQVEVICVPQFVGYCGYS